MKGCTLDFCYYLVKSDLNFTLLLHHRVMFGFSFYRFLFELLSMYISLKKLLFLRTSTF